MGNNKEKQMVENFGLCGISYVHYFHEHIANHKIVIKFVTCKLNQIAILL